MVSYTTMKLPDPLVDEGDRLAKSRPELGYRNRSEFIVESVRLRVIELRKNDHPRKH